MTEFYPRDHKLSKVFASRLLASMEKAQYGIDIYDRIRPNTQIRTLTAMRVPLGIADHLCPNRIEMNITDELGHISVALTENRLMPALKQVSDFAISPVVVLAVPGQDPLHDPPDRVRLP